MPNHKSSSLFHYTRSLKVVKSILSKGFEPCYCIEEYSYTDLGNNKTQYFLGIPMVCFCDIPLSCAHKHQKKYGEYAIVLSKEWAIKKGVNPIFYNYNKSLIGEIDQLKHSKEIIDMANKSKENIWASLCIHNNEVARHKLLGFVKNIENNLFDEYYYENEWRYILEPKITIGIGEMFPKSYKWLYGEDAQLLKGKDYKKRRMYGDYLKNSYLTFDINDIKSIIVPKEMDVTRCIKMLDKLNVICGKSIAKDEKAELYTKVTSIERIRKDF